MPLELERHNLGRLLEQHCAEIRNGKVLTHAIDMSIALRTSYASV